MIVQPTFVITKSENQPLYVYSPDAINNNIIPTTMEPYDTYVYNNSDKDLLKQKSFTNELTSAYNNSNTSAELIQRYKQSLVPSDRAYHSTETIDEALNPPWALHYEKKRQTITPNLSSNSIDMSIHEELPRRLKSAPIVRSHPSTTILNIPEPRFIPVLIPVVPINPIPSSLSRPKTRASSAKARLNTTIPNETKKQFQQREIKSAHISHQKKDKKLTDEEIQEILKSVYGENNEQKQIEQQEPSVQILYTQPQPSPVYLYEKSASWCGEEISSIPTRKSIEVSAIPLNPHYIHRPGVIAIKNIEKRSVIRENSATKKSNKHHHHHYHHSHEKRNEPLRALKPISQKSKISLEIDGIKLTYNPKLTLDDKSSNLTKYFIDGRLYLIKDQYYNIFDNINPSLLEKYNQQLTHSQRSKSYQTIQEEKHHRSKHIHRYVVDPNLISENLNVNRISLSQRPQTSIVYA